jgi:hypothetical protein
MSASGVKSKQKGPYDPQVPRILCLLFGHHPDREHDNDYGNELQ